MTHRERAEALVAPYRRYLDMFGYYSAVVTVLETALSDAYYDGYKAGYYKGFNDNSSTGSDEDETERP